MNTKHPNIKFTWEIKENDSFLDIKITPRNNQLVTLVFGKATFSAVFTNFKSLHASRLQIWLSLRFHCSFSICSSYEKFHEEIVLLKDNFKKNEYPHFFINV